MIILVSGLSGAGKSTVLHALEDLGVFCTDNLPLSLFAGWMQEMQSTGRLAAACIDLRSQATPEALGQTVAQARSLDPDCRLVFLEASDEALIRRYSLLRRRHPFAPDMDLPQAIAAEREALGPLRSEADLVLDSSNMNPYELAELVETYWRKHRGRREHAMVCSLISFSYQRGLPQDADMVVDARFLPNPHYEPELAHLTGCDTEVQDFFEKHVDVAETENRLQDWLLFIWPRLQRERKQYFTLAIGCSGGRHRSVYLVERLGSWLRRQGVAEPVIRHRELGKISRSGGSP
jgi:RNase adapter protein RapZ